MPDQTFAESLSAPLKDASSEAEFLRRIPWTDDADSDLTDAAKDGDLKAFWAALAKHSFGLGPRANRPKVHERRTAIAMSLWAMPERTPLANVWKDLAERMETARESALAHRARKKQKSSSEEANGQIALAEIKIPRKQISALSDWVESPQSKTPSAFELLILAELLRMVGPMLPVKLGVSLWRSLLLAAMDWPLPIEHHATQTGEVPWTLGLLFSHVKGSESLRERGRQTFAALLELHTDTDGTLRAEELERAESMALAFGPRRRLGLCRRGSLVG